MQKTQDDHWDRNPPRVTSFFKWSSPPGVKHGHSPVCGFGWRFRWALRHNGKHYLDVWLEAHLSYGMHLSSFNIEATRFPGGPTLVKSGVTMNDDSELLLASWTILKRVGYYTSVSFTITLQFNPGGELCFPRMISIPTIPVQTNNAVQALRMSLTNPSFLDTKFYLYSAKIGGQPGLPKALFGNSVLLSNASSYLQDLLSEKEFEGGSICNLCEEDPAVLRKLSSDDYGYESDSDLESIVDGEEHQQLTSDVHGGKQETREGEAGMSKERPSTPEGPMTVPLVSCISGRAFAINGTAYQTLKAFIMYTYTGSVDFKPLKSTARQGEHARQPLDLDSIRCSPKSMYRFADYAGIQTLRDLAKTAIGKGLTEDNIVPELFSLFTSKYKEIGALETDFLVKNFTPKVEQAFEETLRDVVLGFKPHCYEVLMLAMRKLRMQEI